MDRTSRKVLSIVLFVVILSGSVSDLACAGEEPGTSAESTQEATRILESGVWGAEVGAWRSKTQLVINPESRQLARKEFSVWDPAPSRNLDFTWSPTRGSMAQSGLVTGEGRLVWRSRDRPTYDPHSIVSVFSGTMRDGRANGRGDYVEMSGLAYDGEWADGRFEGDGHLKLPNGDEYEGKFLAGRPNGEGIYIDAGGERYQGHFVNGRRDGRATTTLLNGLVVETEWQNGVETSNSRTVRLAQAGNSVPNTANDQMWLGVIVSPVSGSLFKSPDMDISELRHAALGYAGSNSSEGLTIRPDSKRLIALWKENAELQLMPSEELPVHFLLPEVSYGVFSYAKSMLTAVNLTLEAQNRSTSPIQITGAYLDVSRSVTDPQPAIQVSVGNDDYCGGARYSGSYSTKVSFENFGWGAAKNATVRFNFVDPKSTATAANLPLEKTLGTIDKVTVADFQSDLAAAHVDVALLARQAKRALRGDNPVANGGFHCRFTGKPDVKSCVNQIGGSQVFGSLVDRIAFSSEPDNGSGDTAIDANHNQQLIIGVVGTLEYDWTDAERQTQRRVSRFREVIRLGSVNESPECGDGASVTRLRENPTELKVDQSDYRIAIPFRENVPAGRVARYGLKLNAARASTHVFSIVLQLANGRTIRSRPINLLYFVPSWFPPRYS
jgi:hypothetical protein